MTVCMLGLGVLTTVMVAGGAWTWPVSYEPRQHMDRGGYSWGSEQGNREKSKGWNGVTTYHR